MISRLSPEDIIRNIRSEIPFEAETHDGSVYIRIQDYVPFACLAIHDGHGLEPDLADQIALNDYERWYEEDPVTYQFIASLPLTVQARESRYAYDLNRPPEEAIYDEAWGRQVWRSPLSEEQKSRSLTRHENFYLIMHALINQLEKKFGSALVFDIHSYNYKRIEQDCPVFNLGTELLPTDHFRKPIDFWMKQLQQIQLNSIPVSVAENDVFKGRGYLLRYVTTHFSETLVLATEIKKVYCDELTGELYPLIIESLAEQFKKAITLTAEHFARQYTRLTRVIHNGFLPFERDQELYQIDKQLFRQVRDMEILNFVNPLNLEAAKKDFYKSRYRKDPAFRYKQLAVDPYTFKRQLYLHPIEKIHDVSLRQLYHRIIDAYSDKVDIIATIGTEAFKYNSLRYFGEPSEQDVKNASYILHFADRTDEKPRILLDARQVREHFLEVVSGYGFNCKVEISRQITSKVLISNRHKIIRIRKDARFSQAEVLALSEHEIGVHMLTTVNAREQKLKVFRMGFPNNTHTQEGLAILSEYLSGNLTISRLKILALRVMIASLMMKNYSFAQSFQYIMDEYHPEPDQAFYLVARIYRGGGFTKDYLYLNGFRDIFRAYRKKTRLQHLLIGKTSLDYLPLIDEMIERGFATAPVFLTRSFSHPAANNPTLDYILDGLK